MASDMASLALRWDLTDEKRGVGANWSEDEDWNGRNVEEGCWPGLEETKRRGEGVCGV